MKLQQRVSRSVTRRSRKLQHNQPSVEFVEPRVLMASGFIQGYDLNNLGVGISGATIQLENTSTNSSSETTTNGSGYYEFNSLAPGNYIVTETASGYVTNGVNIQTTINQASEVNVDGAVGISVTVENPTSENLTFTNYYLAGDVYYQLNSTVNNPAGVDVITTENYAGALEATLYDPPAAGQTESPIVTYCSDLSNGASYGANFTVTPSLTPSLTPQTQGSTATTQPGLATNVGLMAYLYNTYGTTKTPATPPTDLDSPAPTYTQKSAGLQLALWTLEYNQDAGSLTTTPTANDPYYVSETNTSSAIIDAANDYLADAANNGANGNSQYFYFLDNNTAAEETPGRDAGQSMMCTDLVSFTNAVQPTVSVSTAIYNASTNQLISGNQALGTSVYDSATVNAAPSTPTGTVTYYFYNTTTPVFGTTAPVSTQTVTLANGVVPNSSPTGPLAAGADSFIAYYSGNDGTSTGTVEPLTINQGTSSVSTKIYDSSGGAVTDTLGEQVYDTATVTGSPAAFTPSGTVTYYFYNTSSPVYNTTTPVSTQQVTLNADGTVPTSATTAALTAGSDAFIAVYSGDSNYSGYVGSVEPLTINQGTSSVSTKIYDSSGGAVTSTLGEEVYDTATVTGSPAAFTPGGTVTYYFYNTSSPVYGTTTAVSTQQVTLNSNGTVPNSATTAALMTGGDAFIAVYSGDSNYSGYVGSVEPLTVNQGTSSVSTKIYDSSGGAVTSTLGEEVYDTATVTGSPAAFTPSGTVTYYFYNTSSPVYGTTTAVSTQQVTLNSNGTVPNSATTAALMTGGDAFIAVYSGDSNYSGYVGSVEPLTVNQGTSSVSTKIYDSSGGAVTSTLGEEVYDTATVTGSPAAFTPSGTVTYYFYNTSSPVYGTTTAVSTQQVTLNADGTVPTSATTAALTAGSDAFIAVYSGDSNYSGYVGSVEPLTVNQGTSSVSTKIYDSSGGAVTDTLGEQVYDTATVTGSPAAFTPSGTVTYYFYNTSSPVYNTTTPVSTQQVTLNADGTVPTSATTAALTAGSDAFIAVYSGDSNYSGYVGSVEPLTVNQGTSSVSTKIYDSSGGAVTSTLGEEVYDTATVTGSPAAFTPSGTVTYYFYNTSSPVYGTTTAVSTQQVTLNSNGTVPNSATTAELMAGSYAFIGVYSGDSNYSGYVGSVEPLTINKQPPGGENGQGLAVSTMIYDSSGGAVTGALGEKVYDTATVTVTPFTPTGTFTYYFYNTATPVYGTTAPVSTQTVTLTITGTVPNSATSPALTAGSYSFIGVYNGDSNYSSHTGAVEPLAINKCSSSVSTTILDCGGGAVTDALGEKVYDTATVTGTPFTPTGTVTYYFYNTSSPVYGTTTPVSTQQVTLTATGAVPNSATTAALAAGGYSFIGVYSGDSNYKGYQGAIEPLSISKASPSIATTPSPTVFTIGTSCGPLTDSATISGGLNPTGTITFTLYAPGSTKPVDTETASVTRGDGTYTTPKGYTLPSNPTPGVYQWDATYSGDSGNNTAIDSGNTWEQVEVVTPCCNVSNVSFSLTNNGKTSTVSDLAGNTQQGETVTANFTVPAGAYDELTLVTYTAPEGFYEAGDANLQVVSSVATGFFGPGAHTLGPVTIPNSFYQIDFVCGSVITTLGPESTNPNNFYHAQNRFISGDNGGVNPVGSPELQITGTVFCDANNSGTQDSGDAGIAGVTVTLTGTDAYGNSVSYSTTTNSSGVYTFAGMPFSNSSGYTVTPTVPSGYDAGIATAGKVNGTTDGTASSSPESVGTVLMSSSTQTNGAGYNFGVWMPVGISGEVYNDVNGDCKLESGDTGLNGVTITLYNSSGTKVTSTTTSGSGSSAGAYSFSNLAPGTYSVVETILNNYLATGSDVGTVGGTADGTSVGATTIGSIALKSCQSGVNYDFGENQANCSISGKVFCDNQNNCNSNQAGLGGVTVTCYNSSGKAVCTTTSNSSGAYTFTGLAPGSYTCVQTVLGGYNATGCDIGSAGGTSPSSTKIAGIVATSGGSCTGYDFGQRRG